jgi:hypothetical protein
MKGETPWGCTRERCDKLAGVLPSLASAFPSCRFSSLACGAVRPPSVATRGQPWRAPRAPTTTTLTSSFLTTTTMSSRMTMASPPPRSPMSSPIFEARCRSPNFRTPRVPSRYPSSLLFYFLSNCILRFALCDARLSAPPKQCKTRNWPRITMAVCGNLTSHWQQTHRIEVLAVRIRR